MNNPTLEACKCGSKNVHVHERDGNEIEIICYDCGLRTGSGERDDCFECWSNNQSIPKERVLELIENMAGEIRLKYLLIPGPNDDEHSFRRLCEMTYPELGVLAHIKEAIGSMEGKDG